MNDQIAMRTLEDHKYLLLEVQNRAAIAYFAAANRNLSLYNALKKLEGLETKEEEDSGTNSESHPLSESEDNANA